MSKNRFIAFLFSFSSRKWLFRFSVVPSYLPTFSNCFILSSVDSFHGKRAQLWENHNLSRFSVCLRCVVEELVGVERRRRVKGEQFGHRPTSKPCDGFKRWGGNEAKTAPPHTPFAALNSHLVLWNWLKRNENKHLNRGSWVNRHKPEKRESPKWNSEIKSSRYRIFSPRLSVIFISFRRIASFWRLGVR